VELFLSPFILVFCMLAALRARPACSRSPTPPPGAPHERAGDEDRHRPDAHCNVAAPDRSTRWGLSSTKSSLPAMRSTSTECRTIVDLIRTTGTLRARNHEIELPGGSARPKGAPDALDFPTTLPYRLDLHLTRTRDGARQPVPPYNDYVTKGSVALCAVAATSTPTSS
jgi:hypothetical protein